MYKGPSRGPRSQASRPEGTIWSGSNIRASRLLCHLKRKSPPTPMELVITIESVSNLTRCM